MDNILRKLKNVLNGLTEKELDEFSLWIDNTNGIEVITLDENSISLITDTSKLKIDDKMW